MTELTPWITIAHLGTTKSGRCYSAANLLAMVEAINREQIRVSDAGIAARARLRDDRVQVQIHWFSALPPAGAYVVPVGRADSVQEPGYAESVLGNYKLESLKLSNYSSFQRADRL